MSKILIIIWREYKESVFKKSFIITTLLTPVFMLAVIFLPAILSTMELEGSFKIDVIDHSGLVYDEFEKRLDTKLSDGSPRYLLRQISTTHENKNEIFGDLKQKIISEKIDGFIYIPAIVIDSSEFEYYARNVSNFDLNRQLRNTVNSIITDYRIRKSGLDPEIINKLTFNVSIKTVKIKEGKEEKEGGFIDQYLITLTFVMILYLTILLYGAAIMRGILQEKNSRVVEILLSSVNSFQLMVGKIIGLGSVGLTQYIIWSVLGIGFISYGMVVAGKSAQLFSIDPMIYLFFILFFILGYFLYATIYAGIGAMTNTDQEAQQASAPVVILLIIPIVIMSFVVKNPESVTSVILSMIPFFAPILMFTRVNISSPPPLEIWGSVIFLIVTIILIMWIVAKIYRVGILMYGKKPTLPEIMRWIKAK
jgi:ABC-2 type transport system permease protein